MIIKSLSPRSTIYTIAILILILAVGLSTGCSMIAPQPTPTNTAVPTSTVTVTPVPTSTPTPTYTPIPTDTPTPLPTDTPTPTYTSTPDRPATQAAQATQTAEVIVSEIKAQLEKIEVPTDTGSLGWVQDYPIDISLDTYGQYHYRPFAEKLVAADFVLKTDITWDTKGLIFCGLLFRSDADFNYGSHYQFLDMRFSGLPGWAIEFFKDGRFVTSITQVKFSDAINMENGGVNTLILIAEGNKFTVFINDHRLGSYYDYSELANKGYFAFVAAQEAGPSTCTFENTWVWVLKK